MFAKIVGWVPDADNTAVGILPDVNNMIPTMRGYAGSPSPIVLSIAALSEACRGAVAVTLLDGTVKLIAGTDTTLQIATGSAWTDVSNSTPYAGSSSRWNFTQLGDVTVATNHVDTPQFFDHGTSTEFDDITAMPKCVVAEAVGNFLMIANYNNGTDTVDGWACSSITDYTDWTADIDTQCTYGRLYDTPGPLLGLRRLRDYAIYYKRRSMYLARYVGSPTVWEFSLVSDNVGSVSQASIVNVGSVHYFLSDDNFYSFDSSNIQPVGTAIRDWFNGDCNNLYRHLTEAVHDQNLGLIFWYYPSGQSTTLNAWVSYNYNTAQWGKGQADAETLVQYVTPSLTYNDLDAKFTTYGAYSGTYDVIQSSGLTRWPAIFNTSHQIATINGASVSSDLSSNDFGDDSSYSLLTRVRPRYLKSPSSSFMDNWYLNSPGDLYTTDQTVSGVNGKFDVLRSSRWHKIKLRFFGDVELTGADITLQGEGSE